MTPVKNIPVYEDLRPATQTMAPIMSFLLINMDRYLDQRLTFFGKVFTRKLYNKLSHAFDHVYLKKSLEVGIGM